MPPPIGPVRCRRPPAAFAAHAANVTRWLFHPASGHLMGKRDAADQGYSYTWLDSGLLATRTNARGTVTTHTYSPAGDLLAVSHNDGGVTPGHTRTYRRDGSLLTVTDAAGTRTIAYTNAGGARPSGESYSGGALDGIGLAWPEALGWRQSFVATRGLGGPALQSVTYDYDDFGRLATVASPDLSATYAYHPGSSLIAGIEHRCGAGGGPVVTATRNYDALDRLESITYTAGSSAAPVSSHAYLYDTASRRTRATRDDGTHWLYGYNARDEVVSATKHLSGSGQVLAGWQQGFAYDNIGNRTSATEGGDASGQNRRTVSYTANALNQYASIQRPGGFDVLGRALASATVTVNGQVPDQRQGEQWRKEVSADNAGGPAYVEVEASATRAGVGVNGQDITSTRNGGVFVDPIWLEPQYDADGYLLSDGRWAYQWDADNKLREMQTGPAALLAGAPRERYEFTYDSGWRRIRQRVSKWDALAANGAGDWVTVRDERTVYDDWNPVAQIDAAGNVVQRYLWGIDLSGTAQGAGGICRFSAIGDPDSGCCS